MSSDLVASNAPILAVSMGDPMGIGPEVTVKALLHHHAAGTLGEDFRVRLYGDGPTLLLLADELGRPDLFDEDPVRADEFNRHGVQLVHSAVVVNPSLPSGPLATAGRASFLYVERAIEAAQVKPGLPGAADAIVTAPISKEAWHAAGIDYPGHTELLAERFESPKSGMLFIGPSLRVILVTIHIPLREVAATVTPWKVLQAIELGHAACVDMGIAAPRIAVAGINPHAGEHGLFGTEDAELIRPAVERAIEHGMNVKGPLPGDAVFLQAAKGEHDLVVAMYHDQGLIPVKLLDRAKTVNVTTGLRWQGRPLTRTSPAHGTATDIAGQNKADPTSMIEAMTLAGRLVRRG